MLAESIQNVKINHRIVTKGKKNIRSVDEAYVTLNGKDYPLRKSKYTSNLSPVCVSDYMTGKMDGIPSISTSVLLNKFCQARRRVKGSICEKCFAENTLLCYNGAAKNAESNYHLLTETIIPDDLLPVFTNTRIARIESFGDVENEIQALNYVNIIRKNPSITFGWWTKNVEIVSMVFDAFGKPGNLVFIQSSPFINKAEDPRSRYVDRVFTVYSDDYIMSIKSVSDYMKAFDNGNITKEKITEAFENEFINCGARSCLGCKRCYDKTNKSLYVRERLK